MSTNAEKERLDGVFGSYTGKERFEVRVPGKRKILRVAAPNEDAAIVAAANAVGRRWTEYEFYAFCEVSVV